MAATFLIEKIIAEDLKYISGLTPKEWGDVTILYQTHLEQDYFSPIKLVIDTKMVGVAELIVNDKIGWLGNIIVSKEYRNQGLGRILTEHLIEIAKAKMCESIYLLATPLGKHVYEKIGFQEKGKYLFFQKGEQSFMEEKNNATANILPYEEVYKKQIFELDRKAMGDDRSNVLALHLEKSFISKKTNENQIEGFFMPTLGDGLIICNNTIAGFDLIKKRESIGKERISLPEECTATIDFLMRNNYTYFRYATFMYLGKMKTWNPEMVFSRVGGYLG